MNEHEALAKLIEKGRQLVREYDQERAKYHRLTDVPISCAKIAARNCELCEVVEMLGLMGYDEFCTAIHEPEHGPKGIKIVPIELSMRRLGEVQLEPEPKEDEEGYD